MSDEYYNMKLSQTRQADLEHEKMMDWYCKKLHIDPAWETEKERLTRSLNFNKVMSVMSIDKILELSREYQVYKETL